MSTIVSRCCKTLQLALRLVCLGLALGCGGSLPPRGVAAAPETVCFTETGRCLRAGFLAYWQEHGGLAINGYPLTDEGPAWLADGNIATVQYFERVRLEYHPENAPPYDVLLSQLGCDRHASAPPADPQAGMTYFPATGHNVGPDFLAYWIAHGGLAQFGYPLDEATPAQLADGRTYTTQYFEQARFEFHPEAPPPDRVQLGQLGRQVAATGFLTPPDAVPDCRAAALALQTGGGRVGIASGGALIVDATLTNHGASTCALVTTHLPLALLDEARQPLPVTQEHRPDFSAGRDPADPHPPAWAFVLQPEQAAWLRFVWNNWCPAEPPTTQPTLRLTLPSGEPLAAPLLAGETPTGSVPQCNDAGVPSSLTDSPLALGLPGGYDDSLIGTYFAAINRSDYRAAYDLLGPELQAQQPFAAFVAGFADTTRDTIAVQGYTVLHRDPPYVPDRLTMTVRLAAQQRDGTIRSYHGTYEILRTRIPDPANSGRERIIERIVRADLTPD